MTKEFGIGFVVAVGVICLLFACIAACIAAANKHRENSQARQKAAKAEKAKQIWKCVQTAAEIALCGTCILWTAILNLRKKSSHHKFTIII